MKPRLPNRKLLVQTDDILWQKRTIVDAEYNETLISEIHHEVTPENPTGFKVYIIFGVDPYTCHVGCLRGAGRTMTSHLQSDPSKPLEDFYRKK